MSLLPTSQRDSIDACGWSTTIHYLSLQSLCFPPPSIPMQLLVVIIISYSI